MKRLSLIVTLGLALSSAGIAAAQATKAEDEHAKHHPDKAAATGDGTAAGSPTMGKGHGMMMGGDMMGMCPMMAKDAKVEVKNLAKGASITITSDDPKVVARVQKMAEEMRSMHEVKAP